MCDPWIYFSLLIVPNVDNKNQTYEKTWFSFGPGRARFLFYFM